MNFNRAILAGRLTRDPDTKTTPNGTTVCQIGLAINRKWRDKEGEQQEDTTFVDVTAFGKQAELISQYLEKGRLILVEGRLKTDSWDDDNGKQRTRLKVVLESFQFVSEGSGGGSKEKPAREAPARPWKGNTETTHPGTQKPAREAAPSRPVDPDEDVPF